MTRYIVKQLALAALKTLLAAGVLGGIIYAAAFAEPRHRSVEPRPWTTSDFCELQQTLQDYAMWRWQADVDTFPTDFPKAGEPYDWNTGNAIRKQGIE